MLTDASLLGWGGYMGEVEIRGLHSNLLQFRTICLVLKAFLPSIKGMLAQVLMYTTTDMWYCNKQGGGGVLGPVRAGSLPLELTGATGHFPGHEPPCMIFQHQS